MKAHTRSAARSLLGAGLLAAWTAVPAAGGGNPHNLGSCTACHRETPRFGVDTEKSVTFTTSADDPALCAPCHPAGGKVHPVGVTPKAASAARGTAGVFRPGTSPAFAGKVVCVTCHAVHAADGTPALLRGFGGMGRERFASRNQFCADCHDEDLRKRNPHADWEASCASCHASRPKPGAGSPVSAMAKGVCALCHEGIGDKHYAKANPFVGPRDCTGCHDPHAKAGANPRILSAAFLEALKETVVVRPHHTPWFCTACHENTDDYALRTDDVNALCDRCHASGEIAANIHPLRQVPPSIQPPKGWPLAAGALTCLTCHEQGHDDQVKRRYLLRGGPYASPRDICRSCHSPIDLQASTIHVDINQGKNCEYCHKTRPEPGRDRIGTVTFIADPDLLCIRCHDETAEDTAVHHQAVLNRELTPADLPEGLPLYKGRIICATCHNPHQQDASGSRLRAWLIGIDICMGCHRE